MQAVQVYARHFQSQQQDHHDRLVNRLLQKSPKKMSSTSSNRSKSRNGNRPSTRKDGEKQNVMVAVANPSSMEAFDFALHTTEPQDTIYLAHVTPQRRLSYSDIYRLQEDQRLVGQDLAQSVPMMEHLLDQCNEHQRQCVPLIKTNAGRSKYGVAQTILHEAEQKNVDRIIVKSPRHPVMDMGFGVTQVIRRNADTDVDIVSSETNDPHLKQMKKSAQNIWDSHQS